MAIQQEKHIKLMAIHMHPLWYTVAKRGKNLIWAVKCVHIFSRLNSQAVCVGVATGYNSLHFHCTIH